MMKDMCLHWQAANNHWLMLLRQNACIDTRSERVFVYMAKSSALCTIFNILTVFLQFKDEKFFFL